MKIAITGASGFIGSYVLDELNRRRSDDVVLMARSSSSNVPASFAGKIKYVDLDDLPPNVFELLESPDAVIHLAWGNLPNYNSLHHFEKELPRQYQFLKCLIESGLKKLIVAGTCFEYGMLSGQLNESALPYKQNPYGFAKDILRQQLEFLQIEKKFSFTWGRIFYLYGERQGEQSLFSQLKSAVSRGDKVFNMSGGEQLRDYLHVREVAKILVDLCNTEQNVGVVNICSGHPVSIRGLVESWIDDNGWEIDLNFGYYPYPDYEPLAFWGDRGKLNKILAKL